MNNKQSFFSKLHMSIRSKIWEWLGITQLENRISMLEHKVHSQTYQIKLLNDLCKVGVDVHTHHGRSWAVVVIDGKPEYIKFIEFSPNEMKVIRDFLKQFEPRNITIDAPPRLPKDFFFRY